MKIEILNILAAMMNCNNDELFKKAEIELLELTHKAKVYDDVMAIRNNKNYLLTVVVADFISGSESTFFNEKGIEMFVDARGLRESEVTND